MPELFKPTYRGKTGEIKKVKYWYARIHGKRYPLNVADKRVAQTRASELQLQIESGNHDHHRCNLAKKRPIIEHLGHFEESLRNKGCCDKHIALLVARLAKVFDGCNIKRLDDVRWDKLEKWLAEQQESSQLSAQTRKHYAVHLRQFGTHLVRQEVLSANPFNKITTAINVAVDRKIERRPLTAQEFRHLLTTVAKSKKQRCHMMGPERRLLYWLAGVTGLRRNELGSLTPDSFSLDSAPPSVTVIASRTKNRKTSVLPVRNDLADELRIWFKKKARTEILFPITDRATSSMIRSDLKDAGIPVAVQGRRIDFHAMRMTMISHLADNKVHLTTMQRLARHSTPVLTANAYTYLDLDSLKKAVEALPSFTSANA